MQRQIHARINILAYSYIDIYEFTSIACVRSLCACLCVCGRDCLLLANVCSCLCFSIFVVVVARTCPELVFCDLNKIVLNKFECHMHTHNLKHTHTHTHTRRHVPLSALINRQQFLCSFIFPCLSAALNTQHCALCFVINQSASIARKPSGTEKKKTTQFVCGYEIGQIMFGFY